MSFNNLVKAATYLDLEHKCYIISSNYVNYFLLLCSKHNSSVTFCNSRLISSGSE